MTAQNLPPDYLDAMERHWLDAEQLFHLTPPRLANADQLYGLSAECGLKALMLKWGMNLNHNGVPLDPQDRKHVDDIWLRYESYRQGRSSTLALPSTKYFDDWSIHYRYANRSHFQQGIVGNHKIGADIVRNLIAQAKHQGVLP